VSWTKASHVLCCDMILLTKTGVHLRWYGKQIFVYVYVYECVCVYVGGRKHVIYILCVCVSTYVCTFCCECCCFGV